MTQAWSARTSWDEVCRRASGRRHYNAVRAIQAIFRRAEVVRLLICQGGLCHGAQARLARQLDVSRSTICRDVAAVLAEGLPCPRCGAYAFPDREDLPDPGGGP